VPIQQHIQSLHQTMAENALVFGARVVFAYPFHFLTFWFGHRRIIPNHIPGHQGLLGTTTTLRLVLTLSLPFGFYCQFHLLTKALEPLLYQFLLGPGSLRQKPAQSGQTRLGPHHSQQSRQCPSSFTHHQPQQYDHEVLILGLGEQAVVSFGKVAQLVVQTYNGYWHRTPPWFQASLFLLDTTWCPFLLPSFPKVQT
jgi:hypothetical protein